MFLNEGGATIGLWLPLALADLYAALVASLRVWAKDPQSIPVPKRSETLAAWALPMLSKSLRADEEERAAFALFESVERLKGKLEKV